MLFKTPASYTAVSGTQSCFCPPSVLFLMCLGKQHVMAPRTWGLATHMRNLDRNPGSWCYLGPALATAGMGRKPAEARELAPFSFSLSPPPHLPLSLPFSLPWNKQMVFSKIDNLHENLDRFFVCFFSMLVGFALVLIFCFCFKKKECLPKTHNDFQTQRRKSRSRKEEEERKMCLGVQSKKVQD